MTAWQKPRPLGKNCCHWCAKPLLVAGSQTAAVIDALSELGGWWSVDQLVNRTGVSRTMTRQVIHRYRAFVEMRTVDRRGEYRWVGGDC